MSTIVIKNRYYLIFVLVSFLLYGNTLKNGYSLDDEFVTGPKNITAKGFKAIPKVFKIFHVVDESGNTYEYRPLVKATFAIEYGLWSENLALSHLVNVLLYALCLIVLFRMLTLLLKETEVFVLFMMVLVFAFLPVHSEVVASLKNRDVLLSFVFSFCGFSSIIRYMDSGKLHRLVISLILFALAFLSKFDVVPMIVLIPLVLSQRYKVNFKMIISLLVVFLLAYLFYKLTKRTFLDRSIVRAERIYQYFENPLFFEYEFMNRLSAGLNSLGFYTKMLFAPLRMACYYGYNVLPVYSFTSFFALLGLPVAVFMGYVFFTKFRKPDLLWYGVVFFGLSISMYLNVVTPAAGIVADRFMFFASVGFSIIIVYYLLNVGKSKNKITKHIDLNNYQKAILIVVFFISGLMVINRNNEWKDKLGLFEADVKKHPESVKLALLTSAQVIMHMNDGSNKIKENEKLSKVRMSEQLLAKAIKTDSSCAGCYNNIAFLFLSYERNPEAALPYLRLGFLRDSTKKEIACNIGIALFRLGRVQEALPFLFKSIKLDKKHDFSVPYEVLQDVYSKTNPNEGVKFFNKEKEVGHMPELMNVLMGKTYFEAKDTLNSIRFYREALIINPNNKPVADFVNNLEVKYYKKAM